MEKLREPQFYRASDIWGPHFWRFLHLMAASYDPSDAGSVLLFLQTSAKILPCPVCREHLEKLLLDNPPRLDSRESFYDFITELHNTVSKRLGKKIYSKEMSVISTNRLVIGKQTETDVESNGFTITPKDIVILGLLVAGGIAAWKILSPNKKKGE